MNLDKHFLAAAIGQAVAQSATFRIDAHKVVKQSNIKGIKPTVNGVGSAMFCKSMLVGAQFYVNKNILCDIDNKFLSNSLSQFSISFIKIPILNCLKRVQMQKYKSFGHAFMGLVKSRGLGSLYTSYLPIVLEDVVEVGFKLGLYESIKSNDIINLPPFFNGLFVGTISALISTPLDTVKSMHVYNEGKIPYHKLFKQAFKDKRLYTGLKHRVAMTALNSAIMLATYEVINYICTQQMKKKHFLKN